MKPCDPQVIELLNQVLRNELTAINQYFLHAKMFEDWGLSELAKHERSESIDEMQHAEALTESCFSKVSPICRTLANCSSGRT